MVYDWFSKRKGFKEVRGINRYVSFRLLGSFQGRWFKGACFVFIYIVLSSSRRLHSFK